MRSADLRTRLSRVFAHEEKTVDHRFAGGIAISWKLLIPAALALAVLLLATWHAGRESAQLEGQHLSTQLDALIQKTISSQLELERQRTRTAELEAALQESGNNANLSLMMQWRQQLLKSQAEANQYKSILEREQQDSIENNQLVNAFSTPGTRLIALRGAEAAVATTAYAFLAQKGKLFLIACHLPKLPEDRQFQLWVLLREDPRAISAGVFSADANDRALMNFTDASLPGEPALLVITDEPQGGSSAPTGSKLLETRLLDKLE